MDNFLLEKDELYQLRCGEMFFTTKGRLIFHCALCDDNKFDKLSLFELHIKEHLPMSLMDEQIDEANMLQYETYEVSENDFNESNTRESQSITIEALKEENAFNPIQEEITFSKIKTQKRCHSSISGLGVNKTTRKIKTNTSNPKPKHSGRSPNIIKESSNNPKGIREVQTRRYTHSLLTSEETEERKHKCPVCEAAFKDKYNMTHHLKRHSDKKDHKCTECDKRFFTTTEVWLHMRSHKNERQFLCNMCDRSYVSKSSLSEHFKRHSNQRNYMCDICDKAFYDNTQLAAHMTTHSIIRPFSCEFCTASFKSEKGLKNHMKLHENKREFKCEFCDSSFNQRAGLNFHMKTAHKIN